MKFINFTHTQYISRYDINDELFKRTMERELKKDGLSLFFLFYCPRKDARKMASEKFFCTFFVQWKCLEVIFLDQNILIINEKKISNVHHPKKSTLPYAWEFFFIWLNRNAETLSNRVYVPNLSLYFVRWQREKMWEFLMDIIFHFIPHQLHLPSL